MTIYIKRCSFLFWNSVVNINSVRPYVTLRQRWLMIVSFSPKWSSDQIPLVWWLHRLYLLIGLVGRVFANGPGDLGSIPGSVIPKTLKMVLDTSLLNTQQYKVRIKGKVEQHPPLHVGVLAIEKGAFWLPSTTIANLLHIYIYIYTHLCVCWKNLAETGIC